MSSLQILCEKYVQIYQEDLYSPNPDRTRGSAHWHNDNGDLHRTDGPAYVGANGSKEWWINGKAHRTDGPAVEWPDGHKEWWIDGKQYTEKGFNKYVQALKARQDILNKDNPGIEMDI